MNCSTPKSMTQSQSQNDDPNEILTVSFRSTSNQNAQSNEASLQENLKLLSESVEINKKMLSPKNSSNIMSASFSSSKSSLSPASFPTSRPNTNHTTGSPPFNLQVRNPSNLPNSNLDPHQQNLNKKLDQTIKNQVQIISSINKANSQISNYSSILKNQNIEILNLKKDLNQLNMNFKDLEKLEKKVDQLMVKK